MSRYITFIFIVLALKPLAAAELSDWATPFATRDQNPLTLIYGLPRVTAADTPATGDWESSFALNISNTLNIEAENNEALIIDGETHVLDITVHHGLSNYWSIALHLPIISRSAGFMDSAIEDYHDLFGLEQGDRLSEPQDRLLYFYQRNSINRVLVDDDTTGIGDIQLLLSGRLHASRNSLYRFWSSIKLPSGDSEDLLGSGATDIALWLAGQHRLHPAWQLYGNVGFVALGSGEILPDLQSDEVFFASLGGQWQTWRKVALKTQFEWHSSFYRRSELQFLGDALLVTFGATWALNPKLSLDFAVAEDIEEEASPDVNFHFSVRVQH